jgi:hypothetical protein
MRPRPCSLCGYPADVSVVLLLSTLRVSSRSQQSTKSIPFCAPCMSAFVGESRASGEPSLVSALRTALTPAWNALTTHPEEQSLATNPDLQHPPVQVIGQGSTCAVEAEASCRPCVTPCNSRQFDEPQKE